MSDRARALLWLAIGLITAGGIAALLYASR